MIYNVISPYITASVSRNTNNIASLGSEFKIFVLSYLFIYFFVSFYWNIIGNNNYSYYLLNGNMFGLSITVVSYGVITYTRRINPLSLIMLDLCFLFNNESICITIFGVLNTLLGPYFNFSNQNQPFLL